MHLHESVRLDRPHRALVTILGEEVSSVLFEKARPSQASDPLGGAGVRDEWENGLVALAKDFGLSLPNGAFASGALYD